LTDCNASGYRKNSRLALIQMESLDKATEALSVRIQSSLSRLSFCRVLLVCIFRHELCKIKKSIMRLLVYYSPVQC